MNIYNSWHTDNTRPNMLGDIIWSTINRQVLHSHKWHNNQWMVHHQTSYQHSCQHHILQLPQHAYKFASKHNTMNILSLTCTEIWSNLKTLFPLMQTFPQNPHLSGDWVTFWNFAIRLRAVLLISVFACLPANVAKSSGTELKNLTHKRNSATMSSSSKFSMVAKRY